MNRVRSSKSRDARYYGAAQHLTIQWRNAFRAHTPLHVTHAAISTWINGLDITITQRTSLHDKNWALRDYAVNALSRWQLYLDGVPYTFDEIADIASAAAAAVSHLGKGPADDVRIAVMHKICGRHEWETSHDPFYEDLPPGSLNSEISTLAVTRVARKGAAS